jgi:hypothetical protein
MFSLTNCLVLAAFVLALIRNAQAVSVPTTTVFVTTDTCAKWTSLALLAAESSSSNAPPPLAIAKIQQRDLAKAFGLPHHSRYPSGVQTPDDGWEGAEGQGLDERPGNVRSGEGGSDWINLLRLEYIFLCAGKHMAGAGERFPFLDL